MDTLNSEFSSHSPDEALANVPQLYIDQMGCKNDIL